LAASYNGGSVSVFPVETDKKLGSVVDTVTFDPGAQSHSVRVHASGKWAFVPNKGLDSIAQLKFDQSSGQLTPNTPAQKTTASGAGPRHIAFSPNGKFAYVINENNSTLSAFRVSSAGLLEDIETESTLPSSFSGSNTAAHVLVHPNGKYVYGSNRGADNIVVFALANDGSMTLVEFESTRGTTPRNFDIDSEGKVLVVANQGSGSLAVFSIGSDGKLSPLGDVLNGLTQPNAVAIVNVTSE
jgi:6-phosphogluconolactonase